jgi:hypothetical protein
MSSHFKKYREVVLNAAQLAAYVAVAFLKKKKIFLEWARGTGKSFIISYFMREMVIQMPRGAFALVGSSYQQILSRTLPSTKKGMEVLGLYENIDYVVGKNGAKLGFTAPIQSPDKWENIIHFSNGSIFCLISLDNPNSGRGLNMNAVIGDEAALFDFVKLFNNVKTTNRAIEERFKDASLLGAEIYVSSTPVLKKGQWFTDAEKLAIKNPKKYAYIKANSYVNAANLRPGWLEEMKEESPSELHYNAEILNIRPSIILNGFYAQFNSLKHCYTKFNNDYLLALTENYSAASFDCNQDDDIVHSKPLILSIDWGVFLSAVVSQKLPEEYRTLKSFWYDSKKNEEDMINHFCDYYESLQRKVVHLYYGHDGNARVIKQSRETYGDVIASYLRKRGWTVIDKSKGKPVARHNDKYILINTLLKRSSLRHPKLTFNEPNNKDLIISMERAEAIDGKNGIEKVKKDERNTSMKQQHTTHLSDAWDIPVYDIYKHITKTSTDNWDMPLTPERK